MDNYNFNDNNLNYIKETIVKEKDALEIAIDGLDKVDKDVLKQVFEKKLTPAEKSREECIKTLLLDSRHNNK